MTSRQGKVTHSGMIVPCSRVHDGNCNASTKNTLLMQFVDACHRVNIICRRCGIIAIRLLIKSLRQLNSLRLPHFVHAGSSLQRCCCFGRGLDANSRKYVAVEYLDDLGVLARGDLIKELLVVGTLRPLSAADKSYTTRTSACVLVRTGRRTLANSMIHFLFGGALLSSTAALGVRAVANLPFHGVTETATPENQATRKKLIRCIVVGSTKDGRVSRGS
jgi:hypothetical protein